MKNARKYVCKYQTKTSDRFLVTGAAFDVRIFSEKGMCVELGNTAVVIAVVDKP